MTIINDHILEQPKYLYPVAKGNKRKTNSALDYSLPTLFSPLTKCNKGGTNSEIFILIILYILIIQVI